MGAGVPRGLQNRLREAQNLPDEFDPHKMCIRDSVKAIREAELPALQSELGRAAGRAVYDLSLIHI